MGRRFDIYTDGACKGNPGAAGIGVVIKEQEKDVWQLSKSIGLATNNIAEYTAVIYALQKALMLKADDITLYTDSELLYKQCKGDYQIKNPNIKFLFDLIQHLKSGFRSLHIEYFAREHNKDADRLAKNAVKTEQAKAVASELNFGEESPSSGG